MSLEHSIKYVSAGEQKNVLSSGGHLGFPAVTALHPRNPGCGWENTPELHLFEPCASGDFPH